MLSYSLTDFDYNLPNEKIAYFPKEIRDESKLLVYENEKINSTIFKNITNFIPNQSVVIFNNTKVIAARLLFNINSTIEIEIFCVLPFEIKNNYQSALLNKNKSKWNCFVKNNKKWKANTLQINKQYQDKDICLTATKTHQNGEFIIVEFNWDATLTFYEILNIFGKIPLPPYIKRADNEADKLVYQTIYADHIGSVAAPTAGLHFTDKILQDFKKNNIDTAFVQLHVGAGTFKPIKTNIINEHIMHEEYISFSIHTLLQIIQHEGKIMVVGTTSLRTIETMYWLGVKSILNPVLKKEEMILNQWDAYQLPTIYAVKEACNALIEWLNKNELTEFLTKTTLFIMPNYSFKIINGLVTNFHQPRSTLLLIIAAITKNKWKSIYNYALENDFRFLSYGDACYFKL